MALLRGVMGLSAVCVCGFSSSYSLTIFPVKSRILLKQVLSGMRPQGGHSQFF